MPIGVVVDVAVAVTGDETELHGFRKLRLGHLGYRDCCRNCYRVTPAEHRNRCLLRLACYSLRMDPGHSELLYVTICRDKLATFVSI
jgi:hypothetical protein